MCLCLSPLLHCLPLPLAVTFLLSSPEIEGYPGISGFLSPVPKLSAWSPPLLLSPLLPSGEISVTHPQNAQGQTARSAFQSATPDCSRLPTGRVVLLGSGSAELALLIDPSHPPVAIIHPFLLPTPLPAYRPARPDGTASPVGKC
jgi:hypothetical protein